MYYVKAKHKKLEKRYYNVTKGSGEGGGTRFFKTKKAAKEYADSLHSFNTVIKKKKPMQKKKNDLSFDVFSLEF